MTYELYCRRPGTTAANTATATTAALLAPNDGTTILNEQNREGGGRSRSIFKFDPGLLRTGVKQVRGSAAGANPKP